MILTVGYCVCNEGIKNGLYLLRGWKNVRTTNKTIGSSEGKQFCICNIKKIKSPKCYHLISTLVIIINVLHHDIKLYA